MKTMAKKVWKAGTMLYPAPPVMVTCGTAEKANVFTAAWTGIVNSEPPMTYVSVRPSRYSHELISETGEFVINLTTADLIKTADFCGVKSGRDMDKFAETGLKTVPASDVSCPLLEASPVCLECRVTEVKSLGSHDMFLARITAVDIDESLLDETGTLQLEKAHLAAFCHGKYHAVGAELGTFGFSVMKKKTRKRRIAEIKEERREKRLHQEKETVEESFEPKRPKHFSKPAFKKGGSFPLRGRRTEKEEGAAKRPSGERPERPFGKEGKRPFNGERKRPFKNNGKFTERETERAFKKKPFLKKKPFKRGE